MSDPPQPFALTTADKANGLWLRLKEHFEHRLATARLRNDAIQPEAETALLRGEIRCLKGLIALGMDRPIVTGNDE